MRSTTDQDSHARPAGPWLLQQHRLFIARYAARLGRGVAEDLASEAIARSLRHPAPDGRHGPWLERVFHNLMVDHLRRGGRTHRLAATDPSIEASGASVATSDNPEQRAAEHQMRRRLAAVWPQLRPEWQQALASSFGERGSSSHRRRRGPGPGDRPHANVPGVAGAAPGVGSGARLVAPTTGRAIAAAGGRPVARSHRGHRPGVAGTRGRRASTGVPATPGNRPGRLTPHARVAGSDSPLAAARAITGPHPPTGPPPTTRGGRSAEGHTAFRLRQRSGDRQSAASRRHRRRRTGGAGGPSLADRDPRVVHRGVGQDAGRPLIRSSVSFFRPRH